MVLSKASGDVRVRAPGGKDYVGAAKGAKLADGARLRTEAGAEATLSYPDGSKAEIKPSSEVIVRVSSGSSASRPNGLVLFLGRVWARVAKSSGGEETFEVRSANAVAGVRGTEFEVGVGIDGSARVRVDSGEVGVSSEEERTVSVRGGQEVESEVARLGRVSAQRDPNWDGWFGKCAERMQKRGLEVAKSLDGRLNKRKVKVERLLAEQRDLKAKIQKLEARRKRGEEVDSELKRTLAQLERVTERLEDMRARLEGAFGLFERWGQVAATGALPKSKEIGALAGNVAKIAADFADMIEEGTDQSQEGMEELMDDMGKGKRNAPKKGSAADELFR